MTNLIKYSRSRQKSSRLSEKIFLQIAVHFLLLYKQLLSNTARMSADRRMVILTWAVPGQGGEGHVNEQMGESILQKMNQR